MDNKAILPHVFAETAKGNGRPFLDLLADEVRWSIIGSTEWSRTFQGKASVVNELLRPLAAQFDGPNIVTATRFVAEGDVVVVEGNNHSRTRHGAAYPNRYCWVFTMREGRAIEIVEYCDTALIAAVLGPPAADGIR